MSYLSIDGIVRAPHRIDFIPPLTTLRSDIGWDVMPPRMRNHRARKAIKRVYQATVDWVRLPWRPRLHIFTEPIGYSLRHGVVYGWRHPVRQGLRTGLLLVLASSLIVLGTHSNDRGQTNVAPVVVRPAPVTTTPAATPVTETPPTSVPATPSTHTTTPTVLTSPQRSTPTTAPQTAVTPQTTAQSALETAGRGAGDGSSDLQPATTESTTTAPTTDTSSEPTGSDNPSTSSETDSQPIISTPIITITL